MKYFEVLTVTKFESEDSNGNLKIKKVKEIFLVDALTITEAEARLIAYFKEKGYTQDFEVVGAKASKIAGVITLNGDFASEEEGE